MKRKPSGAFRRPGEVMEPCYACHGRGCATCWQSGWMYVGKHDLPTPSPDEPAVELVSARCSKCDYVFVNANPEPRRYRPEDINQRTSHGDSTDPKKCGGQMLFELRQIGATSTGSNTHD